MKKIILFVFLFTIVLAIPSFAGDITFSGRAGLYTPSQAGASASIMYGVGAEMGITQNLSVRGAVETTTYSANNIQYTYTPVTVDLIYRQNFLGMITPYFGAGLSYNQTTAGSVSTQTSGAQAEAGVSLAVGGFSGGIEIRYLIPDTRDTSKGYTTYNGYMTGSFSQGFHF